MPADAVHLCVDMQNLFRPGAPWATPWFDRVLPNIASLVERHPERTVFSRFVTPLRAEHMSGTWRDFYRRWNELTRECIDPKLLELAPELARFAPPARVVDKMFYSPFHRTGLGPALARRRVTTLVISGTETDVCVLATAMDAVDRGFRVVLARDGLCSSSDETHDALMKLYHQRFSVQMEIAETREILEAWRR